MFTNLVCHEKRNTVTENCSTRLTLTSITCFSFEIEFQSSRTELFTQMPYPVWVLHSTITWCQKCEWFPSAHYSACLFPCLYGSWYFFQDSTALLSLHSKEWSLSFVTLNLFMYLVPCKYCLHIHLARRPNIFYSHFLKTTKVSLTLLCIVFRLLIYKFLFTFWSKSQSSI